MSEPFEATDDNWEAQVLESELPVLVDFWAEWCGPCKAIAPTLEELAGDYGERLKVVKVDIDENQQKAQQYNIRSIPQLLLFKDGNEVDRIIGAVPKSQLTEKIEPHLS